MLKLSWRRLGSRFKMFFKPYIAPEVLKDTNRILFITHLALGDFTYMQQFFKKLAIEYPNLKIDLLIDDVRRTYFFWRWKYLKHSLINNWLLESSFINKVYAKTYSPWVL